MNKVLVIAVHPDDETLGCGGTLFRHKLEGDEIHWLIATSLKEDDGFSKEIVQKRNAEIENISDLYQFDSIHHLNISTTKVDLVSISDLVDKISIVVNSVRPNIIYLPFKGDVHSDHKYIFNAAFSCTKSFRYSFINKVYMMETLSETEFSVGVGQESFIPNVFVDISKYIDKKITAMNMYTGEVGKHPFPRSEKNIRALSSFRGASSGSEYAESFMLLKETR